MGLSKHSGKEMTEARCHLTKVQVLSSDTSIFTTLSLLKKSQVDTYRHPANSLPVNACRNGVSTLNDFPLAVKWVGIEIETSLFTHQVFFNASGRPAQFAHKRIGKRK